MPRDKSFSHIKIMAAARAEFLEMGYEKVYNLGGLSNLTEGYFEIVKD